MKPSNKMTREIGAGCVSSRYRPGGGRPPTLAGAAMTQPIVILIATLLGVFWAAGQTVTWTGGEQLRLVVEHE